MTTLEVKHPFTDPKPDGGDTTIVRPSDWNANHPIVMSPGVVGRTTSGDGLASVLPLEDFVGPTQVREILTANRDYYVRFNLGTVTMSIASPAVASKTGHGLIAGDAAVFTLPYDMGNENPGGTPHPTISIASPCVLTWIFDVDGYVSGDPIRLWTTGALPTGLSPNTKYYLKNVTATTAELSLTSGGASINTSGSQSGLHRLERASSLPTGVTAGRIYYVIATGLTANSFQFSETPGGAAVNTSGTQEGKITLQTGNNSNDGLADNQAQALLTPNGALDIINTLDFNNCQVNMIIGCSKYLPDPSGRYEGYVFAMEGQGALDAGYPSLGMAPGPGRLNVIGYDQGSRNQHVFSNDLFGGDFTAVAQVQFPNYAVRFRRITFECFGCTGVYSYGCEHQWIYLDHCSYRGDSLGTYFYDAERSVNCLMHGLFEMYASPTAAFLYASYNSFIDYFNGGFDYGRGFFAYTPQTYSRGFLFVQSHSKLRMSPIAAFQGSYSGPSMKVHTGGVVLHTVHDFYWGLPIPGAAPDISPGSTYIFNDLNTADTTWGISTSYQAVGYTLQRPYLVSELEAAGVAGRKAFVTDANATTFNSVVAGGGSNGVPVHDDGTNWRIG